jgi:adenylyl-sulfate kinase
MNDVRGFCIWFTGLSGSGKTTTAKSLARALDHLGRESVLLDGDAIRQLHYPQLGFSRADREIHVLRIGQMARQAVADGKIALCALISPFASGREASRTLVGPERFVEVFVSTPLAVCRQRDPTRLYARANRGEVVEVSGLDAPYETPASPEILLETVTMTVDENVERILAHLRTARLLP